MSWILINTKLDFLQLDDEKDKENQNKEEEDVDVIIGEEFLRQYISKRMEEMMANTSNK